MGALRAAAPGGAAQNLAEQVRGLQAGLKQLPVQLKVAFMPYKIQMWGTLASICEAAARDPRCVAQVIPLPYSECEKTADGAVVPGKNVYEGAQFARQTPILPYAFYDLDVEHPDVIFLHNIYDGYNTLTRVDERFHTSNLRQFTDLLVYVPYFISPFFVPEPDHPEFWFRLPTLQTVDRIVLAGPFLTPALVRNGTPAEKLLPLGSPKLDAVVRALETPMEYPARWQERLGGRTVFFLNTLYHFAAAYEQVKRVLALPAEFENTAVIWRPHPLTEAFMRQNYPQYAYVYEQLKEQIQLGRGPFAHVVLDESNDYMLAMKRADVMVSASSSLLNAFLLTQKPVIFLEEQMPANSMIPPEAFHYYPTDRGAWAELIQALLRGDGRDAYRAQARHIYANTDGTCGAKVYQAVKEAILAQAQ